MIRVLVCAVFTAAGFFGVTATHFRGGYFKWEPTGQRNEVKLYFRVAYKHRFFSSLDSSTGSEIGTDCSRSVIRNQTTLIAAKGKNFVIEETGDELYGSYAYYTCTDIRDDGDDPELHWTSGYNETNITLPERDPPIWTIAYDSCCWLKTLVNYEAPREWRMRTTIDLTPREDLNGAANTSPYVEGLPLKMVAHNCGTALININAMDKNRDRLECRWTSKKKGECEDNCWNPDKEIFELSKETCTIVVNPEGAEPGLYAVAVMIEDFPAGDYTNPRPYSKIPYQFLVYIADRDVECGRVVTEPPEQHCYVVPAVIHPPFEIILRAHTTDPSIPIVKINMVSQPGMQLSDLADDGDGNYHVVLSWVPPRRTNEEIELICYQAADEESVTGDEICVRLNVGGTPPEPIPLISTPSSNTSVLVEVDNQMWTLYFTEKVTLSGASDESMVTFLFENGTIALAVGINETGGALVGTEDPYFVMFTTPVFLELNTTYTIKLGRGVVVSADPDCQLPSEADEWQFTTEMFDTTHPRPIIEMTPDVEVECGLSSMTVYIEREHLPEIDPSILSFNDPNCYGVVHNETHFAVVTMYGKCGTEAIVNEDETRVAMINNVFLPDVYSTVYGGVLTRTLVQRIRVNCTISTRRVAYAEFYTDSAMRVIEKNETGNSKFALRMFSDDSYQNWFRVWDHPIHVLQNATLYFEAKAFAPNSQPFLEKCVATPTADPSTPLHSYVLIQYGCPVDPTVTMEEPKGSKVRFSVLTFSYLGYNQQSSIVVHCEMRACKPDRESCTPNCPEALEYKRRPPGWLTKM